MPFAHMFSVDVEDYFQVSAFESVIDRTRWADQESRVVQNTNRMLDLLARHKVKAVFYVLGWVAQRFPDLIHRIVEHGHVVGSHTFWHRLVYDQSPIEFGLDLAQSCETIRSLTGTPVRHFRAPSFSITERSLWAVEMLSRNGISFDSSIVPVRHDRYGIPNSPMTTYNLSIGSTTLQEYPVSVTKMGGLHIPCGGGGYFRIFPWWFTKWALKRVEQSGRPIHFYIHPWEIDPEQPRVSGIGQVSRFRHYRNLHQTEGRLDKLFASFQFGATDYPATSRNEDWSQKLSGL
jgi:polysaccharide deacetylase family protein (PEP-CTERM system associated)